MFLIRRLGSAIPTMLAIVTITFFMMRLTPGGPFDKARAVPPEIQANLNHAYHLDEPLGQQYVRYLNDLLHGNFGPSFTYRDFTVSELIFIGFPVSLELGGAAMVLALIAGVGMGTWAAIRRNRFTDHAVMFVSMTGFIVPSFVMAPVLTLVFGVILRWLPAGGWGNGTELRYMILPVIALALPQISSIARLTRNSMIEALQLPFIRTARAKGLPERLVLGRHAIRAAILPVVSYLGPASAGIVTGSGRSRADLFSAGHGTVFHPVGVESRLHAGDWGGDSLRRADPGLQPGCRFALRRSRPSFAGALSHVQRHLGAVEA